MSRTYRRVIRESNIWSWRSSGGQEARNRAAESDPEWKELGYNPRPRHSSLDWPHYIDVYDDIYPSTIGLNYGQRKKDRFR